MQLYKFCIEPEADYKKDRSIREMRYFYFGENELICAWIVEQQQGKTIVKALKEIKPREVVQLDFFETDIPLKPCGLERNGTLLGKTRNGTLSFSFKKEKIIIRAKSASQSHKREQQASDESPFQTILPGMSQSDVFSSKNITFSRHETTSKGIFGEPYYPEAVLMQEISNSGKEDSSKAYVAIGHSQISLKLDLIQRLDKNIFEFPIINFIIDHHPACQKTLLIGWNRSILQAISMKITKHQDPFIQTKPEKSVSLKDCILEDASAPFVDKEGRIGIWKDLANVGTYYAWKRESQERS